jgi:long-chain acyl-CoA synthetase
VNLASLLSDTAARSPDKPALAFRGRSITYAQLDDAVSRAAAALKDGGVEPDDRVALLLGNVPEFVYALYGIWRAGAVAVPLNVMLTAEEVGYILADAGTKAAVVEVGYLPTILAVRDRLSDLDRILVIAGPPVPTGTVSFEQELDRPPLANGPAREDDDLALLQYTSGTTARPKGAMLSHGNLRANLDQMNEVAGMRLDEDDVVLVVLPMFHIYALNVVVGMALRAGATIVLEERFDPVETLALIRRHRVTMIPGAPPMYGAWLAGEEPGDAFGSVRMAVSGAAPLPPEVAEGFADRFGVKLWDSYGLTEAGPAVTTSALGEEPKPGSIGLPLPGLEVRLVDEDGEDVEDGDPGEIAVRGPNVFRGYWGREDESAEAFLPGWWLRTGDVAVRDEGGALYLVDRKKDLIIVSGFNVYPTEVEDALLRYAAVAEVAVIGVPDERSGEAVKAFVVLKPGESATAEQILEDVRGFLARFKVPSALEIVDSLPKHVTGKVLRRALRGEEILGGEEPS